MTAWSLWNAPAVFAQANVLYTVAMRSVPLNEALAEFSHMTGAGISFDPMLIERRFANCVIEEAPAEEVLSCILTRPELDFVRLSSGTFVIVEPREREPLRGSLAGVVRDRETGRPLPYAHVLLASASIEMGTITNADGQFALPPLLPGAYLVNTTYIGYHDELDTLVVQAGAHTFRRIEMEEEPIVFTPLIIDGLQRRRPTELLEKSVLVSKEALEAGQYLQRDAVIQRAASVPGVRVNDLTADAHLQGSDAGEHQFHLDGVPIFLPQSAIGLIGPFSPFAIESITVYQSGFGVEQGSYLAGVVEARQKLEGSRNIDFQIDPMSINSRLAGSHRLSGGRAIKGMAAVRSSLWRFYRQPAFQSTLDRWSRPDPFLIFGPSRQYSDVDPSFFQDILNVSAVPNTDLAFLDIHAAGEYEFNAFSSLRASFYQGKNRFGGTLLPDLISGRGEFLDVTNETGNLQPDIFPAPLSLVDEYRWNNLAGQVTYHTVLGNHTLFNVQARASSYDLSQNYRVIDSLEQYIDEFPAPGTDFGAGFPGIAFNIPTLELQDANDVQELGLEARLEHARMNHLLSAGLEGVQTSSGSDLLLPSLIPLPPAINLDSTTRSTVDLERLRYSARTTRLAGFIQDRIELGDIASVEIGLRATYLPVRKTVYAEPRLALRFDHTLSSGGAIALQTAAGLYRQYLLQFDISTLNAGALFPSKRIWLPVDKQVRPPMAYHLTQSLLYNPAPEWTLRADAYLKLYQRAWTINYLSRPSPDTRVALANAAYVEPNDFQSSARGSATGVSLSISRQTSRLQTSASYEFSSIRRRSPDLFDNATTSVPWEEPHIMTLSVQWRPSASFLASAQFTGVWGRSWGFRKAYYDFFGHSQETRNQPPYDFSKPESHILPPLYQLDLSAVYSRPIGGGTIQIRLDLLNALDYENVVDWRLVWKDDQLVKEERLLYPRIPSLALRFGW